MPEVTPEQLATINLRYGGNTKPLKVVAFADLSSKALFLIGKPARTGHVAQQVAQIINIPKVDNKLIEEALTFLEADHKIRFEDSKWSLTDETKKQIDKELNASEKDLDEILKNHFPQHIDRDILKKWFLEASAAFFGFYGAEWVKAVCKNISTSFSKPSTTKELLNSSINKSTLLDSRNDLIEGFNGFLSSDNPGDQKYIMSLGFAMFSAQLVAADVGADPITIDEIKGSTFILDTNILFAIQLDSHRLSKSITALGKALSQIGAKLLYLNLTKEEYKNVIRGEKQDILRLLGLYPEEIVAEAQNDFIKTAKYRKCKTKEDFETFFEQIKNPPDKMSPGPKILLLDDPETEAIVKKADVDASLKALLQSYYRKLNKTDHKPKGDLSLNHDAALIRVTEEMRKTDKKVWVLTLDRSLQACSGERAGQHAAPAALFLEGLIQILAVNNGGPSQDAADFAPLLTSIIMKRCNPPERTFTIQDLQLLHSMTERVVDFSSDRIRKILNIVTKARLAGVASNDSALILEVNRAYQDEKRDYEAELEENKQRTRVAEADSDEKSKKLLSTQQELSEAKKSLYTKKARWKLGRALLWRVPASILLAVAVFYLAYIGSAFITKSTALDYAASVVGLGVSAFFLLKKPISVYAEYVKGLDKLIKEELG